MTLHNALTGVELHEPKGIAAAVKGAIYHADGAGSGTFLAPMGAKSVIVHVLSDLPAASGGKITLAANTLYFFGDSVNIGTDFLQFSAGSGIEAPAAFTSTITYTGTVPMLQGADVNATIDDITLSCANSDVYSWVDTGGGGNSIVLISDVLVVACKAVGTFDDINTLVVDGSTVVSCTDGIAILGNSMLGFRLTSLSMLSTDTSYIGIDVTGATIQTVNIDGVILTGGAGSIGLKGDAASANIAANFIANVSNVQFQGVTTPLSGITIDDFRWNFQGNGEVADTMPDALSSLTGNATATVLAIGVPTLVAGTWSLERSSQYTTTTGGRATYNGERDLVTPIDASVVINPASGTNKSIRVFIALNGTEITNSGMSVNISSGDPKEISVPWQVNLTTGDFIEVFIENETDSVNCTVADATLRLR